MMRALRLLGTVLLYIPLAVIAVAVILIDLALDRNARPVTWRNL